jgi:SAM-dependent methyltransferase
MLFQDIKLGLTVADAYFDEIFPEEVEKFARLHFTPIEIAKHVSKYLTETKLGAKVLDIGSGAGKFCMVGSVVTDGFFVGIEQRESLVIAANKIANNNSLFNTEFIYGNIVNVPFKDFDAFYIFNSFYENVSFDENLTDEVSLKQPNYDNYSNFVKQQLDNMPIGTRLATYFCSRSIAPDSYEQVDDTFNNNLKLWHKTK